jgi:hypothetical protein
MRHLVLSASFLIPTITVHNLSEDSDQYDCRDEEDYSEGSIKHIAKIGKFKAVSRQSDTQKTVKIHLRNVEMNVEPDSGADVNLRDIPSIFPRNHTSFILLIILFVSCSAH